MHFHCTESIQRIAYRLLPVPRSTAKLKHVKNDQFSGLLFCSPWIVGFVFLFAWPFAASFYWSLCRFDLINPPELIGLENYRRLASEICSQQGFGLVLANTLYYSLIPSHYL